MSTTPLIFWEEGAGLGQVVGLLLASDVGVASDLLDVAFAVVNSKLSFGCFRKEICHNVRF